jgi:hypothetical protein
VKRQAGNSAGSPVWGGVLGAVLLAWSVMIVLTPELGSLVAVFGSPVLAWFVIVRLVGGGRAEAGRPAETAPRGASISALRADPDLLARVSARSGGVCAACGAAGPLSLHAILPVGRASTAIEQRFEALCAGCGAARRVCPGARHRARQRRP